MVLVLTYHRIVPNEAAPGGFFDVSAGELEAQLRLLKDAWSVCVSPAELAKPKTGPGGAQNCFVLTFDDGTADHYFTAAPLLERNGARGIFFVSTSLLGSAGHLTLEQCRELQQRGHAVESHAHDHIDLTSLPADELRRQLAESRRLLREAGLGRCDALAVPGGYFNRQVVAVARECGYQSLRTVAWGFNRRFDPFHVESIIINRTTCGRWFAPLISPRFERAKKVLYRGKEMLKHRLPGLYSRWRK